MALNQSTAVIVTNIISELSIISFPIQSSIVCMAACLGHEACGGVIKHPKTNFKCEFVVDPDEPGAVPTSSKEALRLGVIGDKTLFDLGGIDPISWFVARSACNTINKRLLPYGATSKMKATLMIRRYPFFFVDLSQEELYGTFKSTDGSMVVDMADIDWAVDNPSADLPEHCLGAGYPDKIKYFDIPCDFLINAMMDAFCTD